MCGCSITSPFRKAQIRLHYFSKKMGHYRKQIDHEIKGISLFLRSATSVIFMYGEYLTKRATHMGGGNKCI
jgi:hypothetical protein